MFEMLHLWEEMRLCKKCRKRMRRVKGLFKACVSCQAKINLEKSRNDPEWMAGRDYMNS